MHPFSLFAEDQIPRIYHSNQFIYLQDTEPDDFYYLIEGTARSFISSPNGAERILTFYHAGDLMGEASFFDQYPRVSSAVAVTECKAVSINQAQLDRLFHAHPELVLPMLRYLARRVRLLSGHVDDMSFRPAGCRLAGVLLRQAAPDGTIHCTHDDLGSAIGASRVTVSRLLSEFSARGWLTTGYRFLQIQNREALEEFARSNG